jgi:hypothetical protein
LDQIESNLGYFDGGLEPASRRLHLAGMVCQNWRRRWRDVAAGRRLKHLEGANGVPRFC